VPGYVVNRPPGIEGAIVKVLVVNQNPRLSLGVTSALVGEEEAELLEVRTPERALVLLDEGDQFDLILADNDTAPTGGFALSREVKARGRMGREVPPVVLLIARDQDKFLAKWCEADAFMVKPIDPFDLHDVLMAVVHGEDIPDLPRVGSTRDVPDALGDPGGSMPSPIGTAGY
jgi:CheY-like chemotaxis protein